MKRDDLKEFFRKGIILVEQDDDPFATEDEGAEDEGAEDEGAGDEGAEDEGAEDEGGEDEGADEEGGEEEGPKAEEEDKVRFEKSLDDQLQAIFIDIESDSIKSAQVQEESYSLKRIFLREQDEDVDVAIDVDRFAAETARLILNFDAFFDIEEMIMSKSRSFLLDKYGEEVADEVEELLSTRHDIVRKEARVAKKEEYDEQVPIAVGATAGAGP
jgi:hypothetical protein